MVNSSVQTSACLVCAFAWFNYSNWLVRNGTLILLLLHIVSAHWTNWVILVDQFILVLWVKSAGFRLIGCARSIIYRGQVLGSIRLPSTGSPKDRGKVSSLEHRQSALEAGTDSSSRVRGFPEQNQFSRSNSDTHSVLCHRGLPVQLTRHPEGKIAFEDIVAWGLVSL